MAQIIGPRRAAQMGRPNRWLVDFRDASGKRRLVTCRTRGQAKLELQRALREAGQAPRADIDISLKDYSSQWIEQVRATKKPRTADVYAAVLNKHVLPAWRPTLPLRRLGRAHIKALLVKKRQEGLARDTVANIYAVIRALLSSAVDDEYVSANPASKLGRSLGLIVSSKQRTQEVKAMTQEELSRFLMALKRVGLPYGPLLRTLALTGVRLGEALGMQWADVHIEAGTLRIERAIVQGKHVDTPKSGHGRTVEMGPQLAKTLLRLRMKGPLRMRKHRWAEMPEWVFATRSGEPPDGQHVRSIFGRVLKAAQLPKHFTPHCLRHTFASLLLQRGESPQWVQQQLGHASIQLTVDTYGRWLPKKPIQGGAMLLEKLTDGDKLVTEPQELAGNPRKALRFLH
jgi:integrase